MKVKSTIFAFLAIILFCVFLLLAHFLPENKIIINNEQIKTDSKLENSEIILFAVGDIMLDRGVEHMVLNHGNNDFRFPFLKIADFLKKGDIVFGNLESQISDKGNKIGSIYSFRAEPESINGLKFANFSIVSVANNHVLDYNYDALEDSLSRLKSAGIEYVGAGFNEKEAFSHKTIEINGTKIGFMAYCTEGSVSWRAEGENTGIAFIGEADINKIKNKIKKAKQQVDILVISSHTGYEYQENYSQFQKDIYQSFIDSGADLVLGHHPHVVQPLEKYSSGWIAYSLGNFVFDQAFSEATMRGMLLKAVTKDKKISSVEGLDVKMNDFFQPELGF